MKKTGLYALMGALLCQGAIQGGVDCCSRLTLEAKAKVSAFYPLDDRVRRIYSTMLPQVDIEISARFKENWEGWLEGGYLFGWGRSLGGHQKTELNLIPVSLGVNYNTPIAPCWDLYLGLGVSCNFLCFNDHYYPFVHPHVRKVAPGAVSQIGVNYHKNSFFWGGFLGYDYRRFTFHHLDHHPLIFRRSVTLDGLKIGAQFGYTF